MDGATLLLITDCRDGDSAVDDDTRREGDFTVVGEARMEAMSLVSDTATDGFGVPADTLTHQQCVVRVPVLTWQALQLYAPAAVGLVSRLAGDTVL